MLSVREKKRSEFFLKRRDEREGFIVGCLKFCFCFFF